MCCKPARPNERARLSLRLASHRSDAASRLQVWHLAFSHDGSRLASAGKDGAAIVWRLHANGAAGVGAACEHTLRGHTAPLTFVSWSPDDCWLLTCSADRTARLWDAGSGSCVRVLSRHSDTVTAAAWDASGRVFYTASADKRIIAWDAPVRGATGADGATERACWRVPRVNDLAASADGALLAAVCAEKRVRLWWPRDGTEHWLTESDPVTSLSLSRDGRHLLLNLQNQELHLWDLSSAMAWHAAGHAAGGEGSPASPPYPTAPAFKFRGQCERAGRYIVRGTLGGAGDAFVASGSEDSQLYVWHRRCGDLLAVLPGHTSVVNAVSWSAQQPGLLASASDDRTVRLWASEALLAHLAAGGSL